MAIRKVSAFGPDNSKKTIRKIKGKFAQPLRIDPWLPSGREGIRVSTRKLVVLHQILSIPHVPPDVRVVKIRLDHGENKLHTD